MADNHWPSITQVLAGGGADVPARLIYGQIIEQGVKRLSQDQQFLERSFKHSS